MGSTVEGEGIHEFLGYMIRNAIICEGRVLV